VVVLANLDAEATWAGVVLPARVRARLGATAVLLAALAPEDAREIEIWAPAAVDPARLRAAPGWVVPVMRVGTPARADLAWADPAARAANDRRVSLAIAEQLGVALPGARVIRSLAELDAHVADGGAAASPDGRWVCKAPWTAAGRDRAHGQGPAAGEVRGRVGNLLARTGELVFEPWLDRLADAGACAMIAADGSVEVAPPHGLASSAAGSFVGIDVAADGLGAAERAQLVAVTRAAALAVACTGYRGPLGVDAFAYRDATGARAFHPLCEINARYTFGAVARALARRLGGGTHTLGFGPPPPEATVLIAPAPGDPFTAWLAA